MAKTLRGAVLAQLGKGARDVLADVAAHGSDAGWQGFTYYTDTGAFAVKHRALIVDRLKRDRDDGGYRSVLAFLEVWRSLADMAGTPRLDDAWARYVAGDDAAEGDAADDDAVLRNALAWYALEAVAADLEAA